MALVHASGSDQYEDAVYDGPQGQTTFVVFGYTVCRSTQGASTGWQFYFPPAFVANTVVDWRDPAISRNVAAYVLDNPSNTSLRMLFFFAEGGTEVEWTTNDLGITSGSAIRWAFRFTPGTGAFAAWVNGTQVTFSGTGSALTLTANATNFLTVSPSGGFNDVGDVGVIHGTLSDSDMATLTDPTTPSVDQTNIAYFRRLQSAGAAEFVSGSTTVTRTGGSFTTHSPDLTLTGGGTTITETGTGGTMTLAAGVSAAARLVTQAGTAALMNLAVAAAAVQRLLTRGATSAAGSVSESGAPDTRTVTQTSSGAAMSVAETAAFLLEIARTAAGSGGTLAVGDAQGGFTGNVVATGGVMSVSGITSTPSVAANRQATGGGMTVAEGDAQGSYGQAGSEVATGGAMSVSGVAASTRELTQAASAVAGAVTIGVAAGGRVIIQTAAGSSVTIAVGTAFGSTGALIAETAAGANMSLAGQAFRTVLVTALAAGQPLTLAAGVAAKGAVTIQVGASGAVVVSGALDSPRAVQAILAASGGAMTVSGTAAIVTANTLYVEGRAVLRSYVSGPGILDTLVGP